jgi:hypothetical protein
MASAPAVIPPPYSPPLVDVSLGLVNTPTSAVAGGTPPANPLQPYGGAINGAQGAWILTSGGALNTDTGATGDLASGIEYDITCTPGTVNGVGPAFGLVHRLLAPPLGTLVSPMPINVQVIRFEVFGLHWDTVPAGTQCGKDSGVCFVSGGAAQGCIYDISLAGNGGQNVGFGIVYDTALAALAYKVKRISGGGNPLTANVSIGNPANGVTKPFYLDIRVFAPSASTPAAIQIFLDNVPVSGLTAAQTSWIAGTALPAPGVGPAASIGLMPYIGNNTPAADTVNPVLHFYGARFRMGSLLACTWENQF